MKKEINFTNQEIKDIVRVLVFALEHSEDFPQDEQNQKTLDNVACATLRIVKELYTGKRNDE